MEAVEANFGLSPFKFDIEKYMDVRSKLVYVYFHMKTIFRNIERKLAEVYSNVH